MFVQIKDASCSLSACNIPGTWHVYSVLVHKPMRGQGQGNALLRHICQLADESGMKLRLTVAPFGEAHMSPAQTAMFYMRHGFIIADGFRQMIREPSIEQAALA